MVNKFFWYFYPFHTSNNNCDNYEDITLEHLMLCCLEDEAIIELLENFDCDIK